MPWYRNLWRFLFSFFRPKLSSGICMYTGFIEPKTKTISEGFLFLAWQSIEFHIRDIQHEPLHLPSASDQVTQYTSTNKRKTRVAWMKSLSRKNQPSKDDKYLLGNFTIVLWPDGWLFVQTASKRTKSSRGIWPLRFLAWQSRALVIRRWQTVRIFMHLKIPKKVVTFCHSASVQTNRNHTCVTNSNFKTA